MGDETEAVRRAKAGDSEVWAAWYDQYHPLLYRYAFARLARKEDAEDVAAQAFLAALKAIDRYRYRGRPVLAWLYGIAHNLVAERIRRQQRAAASSNRLRPGSGFQPGPEADVGQLDLREAILRLTPEQREVIILRFLVGLPTREVAGILGKKETAVTSLQVRAIAALRRRLAVERFLRVPG